MESRSAHQKPRPGQGGAQASAQDEHAALLDRVRELEEDILKLSTFQAQAETMKAELERFRALAARAQADLQNAKARMEKDGDEMRRFAAETLLRQLLPVIDHFQRAFKHLPQELASHEWVKGVTAIEQDFLKQVHTMGLRRMEVLGEIADPARHEILLTGPGEEGRILEVIEDGYEFAGRVLRAAKVKVGTGKGEQQLVDTPHGGM